MNHLLNDLRKLSRIKSPGKLYTYAIIVGIISGLIALLFNSLLHLIQNLTFHELIGLNLGSPSDEIFVPTKYQPFFIFFLPIIGSFLSMLIIHFFDQHSKGAGTDAMIDSFHNESAKVSIKTPFIKMITTILNLATGGSAGKEGPMSQIGASIGSIFSKFLDLGARARRSLFLAGMAGALGAIFQAPLGAAIVAVEILYKHDFESDSLLPCIISSLTGYFIFTSIQGFKSSFNIPHYQFTNWNEIYLYLLLGILCFIFGYIFIKIFNFIERYSNKIPVPFYIKGIISGALVGSIGLISYESIGSGFNFLYKIISGEIPNHSFLSHNILNDVVIPEARYIIFFLCIIFLKILATSFNIGMGVSGGLFGPSLFIGGILGAMVGFSAQSIMPNIIESPVPFIIVGMAGFFSGVANAPIGSVIMVCELTSNYSLLAPLLLVSALSSILSSKWSIYKNQKNNKFESPAHNWEMTNDFLENIQVKQAYNDQNKKCILDSTMSFKELCKIRHHNNENDFIIKNKNNIFVGVISFKRLILSNIKENTQLYHLITDNIELLSLDDPLTKALKIILNQDLDKIAVVSSEKKVLGYLSFRNILNAYRENVILYREKLLK